MASGCLVVVSGCLVVDSGCLVVASGCLVVASGCLVVAIPNFSQGPNPPKNIVPKIHPPQKTSQFTKTNPYEMNLLAGKNTKWVVALKTEILSIITIIKSLF